MALPRFLLVPLLLLAVPSPLRAQAPRGNAEAEIGGASVSIEYGAPPWSEQRRAQIDQMLPVGAVWRLGADTRTTLVVAGGAVAIGDVVVEPGGYGLNLRRIAEKEWAFVVYDGSDTNVALEDSEWDVPASFADKKDASPERLVVSIADAADRKSLVVRFGPIELSAPMAAVETKETDVTIGGEQAAARWFSRAAADAPKPGSWSRVGSVGSFYVRDVDCGMDVELRLNGPSATVRFVNRERAKVADRLARVERDLAQAKRAATGQGPGARRFQSQVESLEASKAALTEELDGLAANPPPFEMAVPLGPTDKPNDRVAAELATRNGRLFVVVSAGDRAGQTAVDEARLLPAAKPAGGN